MSDLIFVLSNQNGDLVRRVLLRKLFAALLQGTCNSVCTFRPHQCHIRSPLSGDSLTHMCYATLTCLIPLSRAIVDICGVDGTIYSSKGERVNRYICTSPICLKGRHFCCTMHSTYIIVMH